MCWWWQWKAWHRWYERFCWQTTIACLSNVIFHFDTILAIRLHTFTFGLFYRFRVCGFPDPRPYINKWHFKEILVSELQLRIQPIMQQKQAPFNKISSVFILFWFFWRFTRSGTHHIKRCNRIFHIWLNSLKGNIFIIKPVWYTGGHDIQE